MSEQTQQIHAALVAVMQDIEAIGKNRRNNFHKYDFRGIDDVYNAIHPLIKKHGIFCAPSVLTDTVERREANTKDGGKMMYTSMSVLHRFYAADGSFLEVTTCGEGMDAGDKGAHKAQSMAMKIAYIEMFAIPIKDKPEDRDADYTSPPAQVTPPRDVFIEKFQNFAATEKGGKVRLTLEKAGFALDKIATAEEIDLDDATSYEKIRAVLASNKYDTKTGELSGPSEADFADTLLKDSQGRD